MRELIIAITGAGVTPGNKPIFGKYGQNLLTEPFLRDCASPVQMSMNAKSDQLNWLAGLDTTQRKRLLDFLIESQHARCPEASSAAPEDATGLLQKLLAGAGRSAILFCKPSHIC